MKATFPLFTILVLSSLSGCAQIEGAAHTLLFDETEYEPRCSHSHDDRPLRAGVVQPWGERDQNGDWEFDWYGSIYAKVTSEPQIRSRATAVFGYGSRRGAERACEAHVKDFPGHECKVLVKEPRCCDNMG